MDIYVSKSAKSIENGTKEYPFSTIGQAASIAQPGDTVWIGGGIYREWVSPENGGSDEEHRIAYRGIPGETAIISGAEVIENWKQIGEDLWTATIPKKAFCEYNPYNDLIFGDWHKNCGQPHHTGEIFMDGTALFEAPDAEHMRPLDGPTLTRKWFVDLDGIIEVAEDLSRFHMERKNIWTASVNDTGVEITILVPGINPNAHTMEATVRPFCFFPRQEGRNYITVSNLTIEKAATQWAPPTAFQSGAIGTHWSKGWIIENCVIRNSKCSGISLGKRRDAKDNIWSHEPSKDGFQTQMEIIYSNLNRDWAKDTIGSHLVQNNEIYDCGQAGIVGCMGGAFSVIRNNHIHHINTRQELGGAEMAGIKLHCGIDVQLENNLIHDCIRGIWLDWEAQGVRVSKNRCFANVVEDLFIEVSHGPCTVDHNLFLSQGSLCNAAQGTAFVHNLIAGKTCFYGVLGRFVMYHIPHDTRVAGSMVILNGDDKVLNNIYVGNHPKMFPVVENHSFVRDGFGTAVYDLCPTSSIPPSDRAYRANIQWRTTLPVWVRNNVYFNGAKPYIHETDAVVENNFEVTLNIVCEDGLYYLETNLPDYALRSVCDVVSTDTLGVSFEAEACYENADGTPFILDHDLMGESRDKKTAAGPFVKIPSRFCLHPSCENK